MTEYLFQDEVGGDKYGGEGPLTIYVHSDNAACLKNYILTSGQVMTIG